MLLSCFSFDGLSSDQTYEPTYDSMPGVARTATIVMMSAASVQKKNNVGVVFLFVLLLLLLLFFCGKFLCFGAGVFCLSWLVQRWPHSWCVGS